ncbi:hypothetical protein BS78_06G043100 [Paspalum vaginatum]|nr:hypothetical protein BS78_06G043100 [Paspalum vaginatum]
MVVDEEDEEANKIDMDDGLSISMPSNASLEGGSKDRDEVSSSENDDVSASPAKRAKRVHRAKCWKYFKEIKVASSKERGVMVTKAESQGTLSFAPDKGGSLVVNPNEYEHDHTRQLIAKMIIVHEYPFRMVEHTWFNVLMNWLNPHYEFIGSKGIRKECMNVYESEKEILNKSLRDVDSISLTSDLWTSNQNIGYMCLVAHYIDPNWVMQCRVLNFIELDPPHTGAVIAQAVFDCLVKWKIEDKITTITLDNANNNATVVASLVAKFAARKNSQFNPIYFHVHCSSHIVNLLRNIVKYFEKSPSRLHKFMAVCNEYGVAVGKGLCLDRKTRWNSTYKMLDSCIAYRNAFTYYADKDTNIAFSGSTYPTANMFYPYIVNVKIALVAA